MYIHMCGLFGAVSGRRYPALGRPRYSAGGLAYPRPIQMVTISRGKVPRVEKFEGLPFVGGNSTT